MTQYTTQTRWGLISFDKAEYAKLYSLDGFISVTGNGPGLEGYHRNDNGQWDKVTIPNSA